MVGLYGTRSILTNVSYMEPALPVFLLLALGGLIRAWRASTRKQRPWLLTFSFVGILVLSSNFTAWLFSLPLQIWYEPVPMPRETADAIVVLAGALDPPAYDRPY